MRRIRARTSGPEVALQADLPSIVVPTIGLSLETIAADLRTFFHISDRRWNISGELTIAQKQLRLRLRMNGRVYSSPNGVDPEGPDDLLAPAAEKVLEWADPYIAAWSLRERDLGKSLEIARKIIADLPKTDPIVPWAQNLIGVILNNQREIDGAIAEYKKAIELDPSYASPHNSLGLVLREQGKTGEAIAEYEKVIALDPRLAVVHNNLGEALREQGKTAEAIAEYKKAIELGPQLAAVHKNLGEALRKQGKTEEATAEYEEAIADEKAIALDPRDARFHNNLGDTLREQGKIDEAIAEYKKAIELDPSYASPHNGLGLFYASRARPRRRSPSTRRPSSSILGMRGFTTI